LLPTKFGRFAVRVRDPRRLALDLSESLQSAPNVHAVVEGIRVSYEQGAKRSVPVRIPEHLTIALSQKPASYASEYEYRLIVIGDPRLDHLPCGTPCCLSVPIAGLNRYCEAVDLPP